MLNIFANTFKTATRTDTRDPSRAHLHWRPGARFDNRHNAELEAHLIARRRD